MTAIDPEERRREALSLVMLGVFFVVLAVLVLIGSWWAVGRTHALVVNLGAGGVLLLIGLAMWALGRRLGHRADR